jgi:hypothetical protein
LRICLAAFDRVIGRCLHEVHRSQWTGAITKVPCEGKVVGRSSVDRGKQGTALCGIRWGARPLVIVGRAVSARQQARACSSWPSCGRTVYLVGAVATFRRGGLLG